MFFWAVVDFFIVITSFQLIGLKVLTVCVGTKIAGCIRREIIQLHLVLMDIVRAYNHKIQLCMNFHLPYASGNGCVMSGESKHSIFVTPMKNCTKGSFGAAKTDR